MADDGDAKKDESEKKVVHTYPLCRVSFLVAGYPEFMLYEDCDITLVVC